MTCPYPARLVSFDSATTLELNDTVDADDIFWSWESMDGWFGTEVKSSVLDGAGVVGAVIGEGRLGSKPITLKGFAGVKEGESWWLAANKLEEFVMAMSNALTPATLQVDEPVQKEISVVCSGRLLIGRQGILRATPASSIVAGFVFQIPLTAPDPRKTSVAAYPALDVYPALDIYPSEG